MSLYTLRNSIHGTSVVVRCTGRQHIYDEVIITPTKRQWRRIEKELCGVDDCRCGTLPDGDNQTQEMSNDIMRWTASITVDQTTR